jgi:NADH-quinone oxidoreductase subunit A
MLITKEYIPEDYIPIMIQSFLVILFVIITIIISHLLGPKRKTKAKLENFECGIEGMGNARSPFSIKYFLIAILFVLFDVEVIFMYPWAINLNSLGIKGLLDMFFFLIIFLIGFGYIVLKDAFKWTK